MFPRRWCIIAIAIAASGCTLQDPALAPAAGAPAYVPANASPPMLGVSANEIVGPAWRWQRTQQADGKTLAALAPERYTLKFEGGGRVLVQADCNRGSGAYEVNGNAMKLGPVALTRMGCPPDSQDVEFTGQLQRVASYAIVNSELVLTLSGGDAMRFLKQP